MDMDVSLNNQHRETVLFPIAVSIVIESRPSRAQWSHGLGDIVQINYSALKRNCVGIGLTMADLGRVRRT